MYGIELAATTAGCKHYQTVAHIYGIWHESINKHILLRVRLSNTQYRKQYELCSHRPLADFITKPTNESICLHYRSLVNWKWKQIFFTLFVLIHLVQMTSIAVVSIEFSSRAYVCFRFSLSSEEKKTALHT